MQPTVLQSLYNSAVVFPGSSKECRHFARRLALILDAELKQAVARALTRRSRRSPAR